jgi:osmotically inducible lipoprotein OsmB
VKTEDNIMNSKLTALALVVALAVSGCANMTRTQQRMLSGAAIGATGGAAIVAIAGGSVLTGAAVGAAAGTVGGLLVDQQSNPKKQPTQQKKSKQ